MATRISASDNAGSAARNACRELSEAIHGREAGSEVELIARRSLDASLWPRFLPRKAGEGDRRRRWRGKPKAERQKPRPGFASNPKCTAPPRSALPLREGPKPPRGFGEG